MIRTEDVAGRAEQEEKTQRGAEVRVRVEGASGRGAAGKLRASGSDTKKDLFCIVKRLACQSGTPCVP